MGFGQDGGWLAACNVATRSVPLRHVARIVVPFFTRWIGRPSFRAHRGRAPLRKFRFRRGVPSRGVLRSAAPKLIARPREHRRSFVVQTRNSVDNRVPLKRSFGKRL